MYPYRVTKPIIVSLDGTRNTDNLVVTFNSSQFGLLNRDTGDFQFLGQN